MNTHRLARTAAITGLSALAYMVLLAAARPWHRRWGAIDDEIEQTLPGDELSPGEAAANHAVTSHYSKRPRVVTGSLSKWWDDPQS